MPGRLIAAVALLTFATADALAASSATPPSIRRLQDLGRHVGEYPCGNGLLEALVLLKALRSTLGGDYPAYREHMSFSGCSAIERHGEYLLVDVSQLHVGRYTSVMLVHESDGVLFLVWLKSTVAEGDIHVYGPRPVPDSAKALFVHALNVAWGHVACFSAQGDTIQIDTARRANQDTGECIPLLKRGQVRS